jgi:phosphopantothenoylcysteine decarboxylase/phosphopantothenate--cysteine ligase
LKRRFLIASGPTREPIDPVRYLSNYSTGTMGRCVVEAAKARGHRVDWIQCPFDAETARDLEIELRRRLGQADVLVMAAAVCDSRPRRVAAKKIKKENLGSIALIKNPDILAGLAKRKKSRQVFIGFALESQDIFKNALSKLKRKKLDLIVLQQVTKKIRPFGDRSLEAFILKEDQSRQAFKSVTKKRLAEILVREAEKAVEGKR